MGVCACNLFGGWSLLGHFFIGYPFWGWFKGKPKEPNRFALLFAFREEVEGPLLAEQQSALRGFSL